MIKCKFVPFREFQYLPIPTPWPGHGLAAAPWVQHQTTAVKNRMFYELTRQLQRQVFEVNWNRNSPGIRPPFLTPFTNMCQCDSEVIEHVYVIFKHPLFSKTVELITVRLGYTAHEGIPRTVHWQIWGYKAQCSPTRLVYQQILHIYPKK